MVPLLGDATETGALIDAARGDQDALGPQRDRCVTALAREADALLGQCAADAESARLFLQEKQPQFGDLI
jgi:hypothetical protein